MDRPGRGRDSSRNRFLTLVRENFIRWTQTIQFGFPVPNRYRGMSSNSGAHLQSLLLATLVFTSLACVGIVIVSLVDHYMQPAVTPVILWFRYALVILISGSLSILVHRRLRRDGELAWAYRTLGEGAEEREVAAVVDEVARIVTSTLDINDVYHRFCAELNKLVDSDRITIITVDQEAGTMEFKYAYGRRLPRHAPGEVVPLRNTRTKEVVETGKTHVWTDTDDEPHFRINGELPDRELRAGITTPLNSNGHAIGVLNLRSKRAGTYDSREQAIVKRLATQIAPAVKNAQLYEESLQIESELRQSEARIRALWEAAPQGIIATNESGEMVQVNDAALEIFGYGREELLGRSVDMLLPQGFQASHASHRESYFADPKTRSMNVGRELQGLRKDGSLVPLEIGLSFVPTESGTVAMAFITDISQRTQAEEAERRWARETEVLAEIGRVVTSSLDINDVYASLGEQARKLLPFDHMSLSLIDQEKGVSYLTWVYGQDVPGRVPGDIVPLAGAFVNEVVLAGSPVVLSVDTEENLLAKIPRQLPSFFVGMRSFLGVPLFFRDDLVGVLQLQSKKLVAYSQRDSELAERIGNQIAGAVANSQLYAERSRLADESAVMSEIGRVIGSSLNLDEVYHRVGEVMRELIPFDQSVLSLVDPQKRTVIPTWVTGADVSGRRPGDETPLAGTLSLQVISDRSPLIVDVKDEKDLGRRFPGLIHHFEAGMRSFIATPLIYRDEVIGVLQLASNEANRYTQRHKELAERAGNQITGAIANFQLYAQRKQAEEAQRRLAEVNSVMAEIGRIIGSSLDINEIYELLGSEIKRLIHFDQLDITVIDRTRKWDEVAFSTGLSGPSNGVPETTALEGSFTGRVAVSRSGMIVQGMACDVVESEYPCLGSSVRGGSCAWLVVPLLNRDESIGALFLTSRTEMAFTQDDLNLAGRVAHQMAGAIANAQLYADRKRLAEENSVMASIGRIISSSLDIDAVYDRLGEETQRLIQFDRMSLSLYDADAQAMSITYVTGTDVPGRQYGAVVPLEGTIGGEVVRTKSPVLITRKEDEDILERFPGVKPHVIPGSDCFIAVPLLFQEELIGIYHLVSGKNVIYTHRHLDIAARIGNQIAGAIANSQLFAERGKAEEAARASENKYRTLVNESPDMIFISRIDNFRFTEVNALACEHYGYSSEEFLTMAIFDLEVEPPLKQQVRDMYDNTPVGQVLEIYGTNKRKDGTTFPVHVRFSKLDDDFAIANVRDITDQRAAEEKQHRFDEENSVMVEIGKVINSSLDINDVYEHLGEQIRKLIPFDRLVLTIINKDSVNSTPTWIIGIDVPGRHSRSPVPLAGSVAGQVARTRLPSLLEGGLDSDLGERYPGLLPSLEVGLRSFMSAPLIYRDEVIAVLQLRSMELGAYSQRHLELAERIASQIAGAIANAQMYESLEDSASELAVGDRIADIMTSTADADQLYEKFSGDIKRLMDVDRITIIRIDREAQSYSPIYIGGMEMPERHVGMTLPIEGSVIQFILDSGHTLLEETITDLDQITSDRSHIKKMFRSSISVPLRSEGQIMNTLHLQCRKSRAYGPNEMAIIERYADRIAPAIENARLDAEAHRHAEETAAMAEIGRTVSASLDINEVYEHLGEDISRLIPFDHLSISLINNETQTTTPMWLFGTQVPGRLAGSEVPLLGALAGEVVQTRSSVSLELKTVDDVEQRYPLLMPAFIAGLRTFLAVPLIDRDVVIGVLQIRSNELGIYNHRYLELAERIANQIAGAIANSQLYFEHKRLAEENSVMAEIGRIINSSADVNEVHERLGSAIRAIIPFDRLTMALVDRETGDTSPTWVIGVEVPGRLVGNKVSMSGGLAGEVVDMGSSRLLTPENKAQLEREYPQLAPAYDVGLRSFMVVPLIDRDVVIGVLRIVSKSPDFYTQFHLELAERIGNQIAGAIANSQLYVEHQRLAEENSVIAELGRIINSSLDVNDVYGQLGDEVRKLIPFDRFVIALVDEEDGTASTAWKQGIDVTGRDAGQRVPLDGALSGQVIRTKLPVFLEADDAADLINQFPYLTNAYNAGLRSFMTVPLIHRAKVIGLLRLGSKTPRVYNQYQADLAIGIGSQISGAIANSQLYLEHQRLAEENSVMAEIGRIIGSSLDISDVYEGVYREMRKLVPFDRISVNLADVGRGNFICSFVWGVRIPGRGEGYAFPISGSFSGAAFLEGASQVCHPSSEAELTGNRSSLIGAYRVGSRSCLSVPLISAGSTIGTIQMHSTVVDTYTAEVVEIAERIAALVAPALENARLYAEQKKSLNEKEVLLQEINHRVKNNLQIISSLLNLQSRDILDPQVLRAFRTGQDRIGAMAMVHEKLYQSEDLARIDFGEYIESLAANLINSYGLGSRDINL